MKRQKNILVYVLGEAHVWIRLVFSSKIIQFYSLFLIYLFTSYRENIVDFYRASSIRTFELF